MANSPRFSASRSLIVIGIGISIVCILGYEAIRPINIWASQRFAARGESALITGQYDRAETEYRKALTKNPQNTDAQVGLTLSQVAATDPIQLKEFWQKNNDTANLSTLEFATEVLPDAKRSLERAVALLSRGQAAFAQYQVQQALIQDENYPEALHYAALIYDQLASSSAVYRQKAVDARAKRDSLTPAWLGK